MALATLGVASAVVLAGCSSSGGNSASPSSSPSASSGWNAAIESVVRPSTKQGGTLNLGALSDCDSWDPARTYYSNCWVAQRLLTRTLLAYNPVPGKDGSLVSPDLATAMPTVSSDGLTWTFNIPSGLKFEGGLPLTTKDIKYGLERLWATDVINGGPSSYYLCLLDTCDKTGAPQYKGPYTDKNNEPQAHSNSVIN